jgi:hypothetical protein
MGKETTMLAVTAAGLMSAGTIVAMQKYFGVSYVKGVKLASPGLSIVK